ncbi:flagellar filament capping protein FliD [Telmatospirillum siberiense]|uniref:Flagellar hook-associated protein 2 n=1 Tax=Telmatospirillum siberiense TaxID=382514 RepID=A0A2N3Q020_9PROT|nr:flagellar filament capping protein FliD [Telmatospirillum siberiense]PKU25995.1 hypothetical protein CWS72_02300 [Telmatospirillum siberiense]
MSSVSTSSTVSTGNATDISTVQSSNYSVSLASAVTTKVQPYLTRADSIATEITTNKTKIAAYQSMQSLLLALKTATSNLSSQSTEGTNVFNSRSAGLTSKAAVSGSTPSDASTLLSATVNSGTNSGTHTVVVNQLAAAEEDVGSTINLSSTAVLSSSSSFSSLVGGTFSISETGKQAVSITLTSSMSLTDVASAINGNTDTTGVSASVVTIDSTHSVLVVSGQDTDVPLEFSDGSGILSKLGLHTSSTTQSSTATISDTTSALGLAGAFTINGGVVGSTATAVSVTITSTMSLADVASTINAAATAAGISGTMASLSGTTLTLSSGTGGSTLSFSGISGDVLSTLGIDEVASNGAVNQVNAAQAAILTIDGVSGITRTTNSVTDALSGVSLDLTGADSNTIVTVTVQPNTTSIGNTILAFMTAYNNWESFVQMNEATGSDGTASSSATLFGDSTLREVSLDIDSKITSMISSMTLADIGLTLNSSNELEADTTTLTSQLKDNFSNVLNLFQSHISSSSYTLQTRGTDYSTYSGTFNMTITKSSGSITGITLTLADGSTVDALAKGLFTVSGQKISGVSGSAYDSLNLTYTGENGTATVTVSATVGLANQLYTTSKNYGNTLNGTVENLIENLQDEDTALTSQYNTIINQANSYATFLLQQYSSLTSTVQAAAYASSVLSSMFAMQTSS